MSVRVQRRLGATEALFTVALTGTGGLWDDDTINQWSATRGGEAFGVQPSTASAVVNGEMVPQRDPDLRILLTPYGSAHVAALVGNRTATDLEARWEGRLAGARAHDTPNYRATTLAGADLFALAAALDPTIPAFADGTRNLPALYEKLWFAMGLDTFAYPTFVNDPADRTTAWDAVRTNAARPWTEVADKYTAQAGVILQTLRDGNVRARNMLALHTAAYRWDLLGHQVLTRHHCTSPAEWESVLNPAKRVQGTLWHAATESTETYPAPSKALLTTMTRAFTTETLDLTHINSRTNALYNMLDGMWNRANDTEYHVPEVTIDVLRLLTSPREEERAMAGQLLTLESWDTVALAYDWPEEVRGTYFAATITESVTPTTWTITLGLLPSLHVVGQDYQHIGSTWATSYPDTTAWDTPVTTTWATAP